ncbi:MAG TPA: GGDEF domain-containing protein [Alteromonas sp.]|nr:GGDEF domain-containing protein [Alteromonas sp.]|tara:strand:+ start:2250 stop:3887 length:1638 start_codon:yes stop_codon:yes gene_type:complete
MFSSIRTVMAVILSIVVMTSSTWVLWLAVAEHEELFLESQKNNLFALTRNMANDLVPYMEQTERDSFALNIVLLRLEPYNNVINATIYDNEYNQVEHYVGRGARRTEQGLQEPPIDPSDYELGISIEQGKLISLERIGEQAFPVGYLLIVNDLNTSLAESRRSLIFRTTPWVVLLLTATIFLSLIMLRRSFKPLELLSRFTQMVIDSKDYTSRHNVQGTSEIKRLGEHINRLMATIEGELSINQQQTQTLMEQQVTMTQLANFDSLTGLPNRQFVMDTIRIELSRAKRADSDLILMFFDLDGFKGINDSLGHETGDMILIEVAERVKAILRDGDILARLGGDEFLIIPDRDVTELNMATVSERVLSAFVEPFKLKGLSLRVGLSIGVAKAREAGYDLSQLVSNADLAMYRSKARGRGVYTIFSPEMSESHKRKILIANSIEAAIEENQFSLYYQPKINLNGEIDSLEALIRWHHPELGPIMPSEFIPVAEQAGKITSITQWVLNQASKELVELMSIYSPKIRLAINLSVHDLRHSELFNWMAMFC